MALSSLIKTMEDGGVITLYDGTGTPITLTVRYDKADFKIAGLKHGLRESTPYQSRGKLRSVRKAKVIFPTLAFTAMITDLSETGTGTLMDWVAKTAGTPFTSRVKTMSIGDVDTCHVKWTQEGTDLGDGADQSLRAKDVELSIEVSEADPNIFSLSGIIYGDIDDGASTPVVYFTAPR